MDSISIKAMVSELAPVIREYVAAETGSLIKRIAELESRPAPELDSVFILQLIEEEIAKIPPAENGKIAPDMLAINEAIVDAVSKAVAEIPIPKDGNDAAGIVEVLQDAGELVLTLADGRVLRTGIRDGEKGQDGKDGRDGFNLEDFDVQSIDERSVDLRFRNGDVTHSFELKFPIPVYRGVFKHGESYLRGDIVTWGGCAWHCKADTLDKPDSNEHWELMVKKGRDGKDAKNGC